MTEKVCKVCGKKVSAHKFYWHVKHHGITKEEYEKMPEWKEKLVEKESEMIEDEADQAAYERRKEAMVIEENESKENEEEEKTEAKKESADTIPLIINNLQFLPEHLNLVALFKVEDEIREEKVVAVGDIGGTKTSLIFRDDGILISPFGYEGFVGVVSPSVLQRGAKISGQLAKESTHKGLKDTIISRFRKKKAQKPSFIR